MRARWSTSATVIDPTWSRCREAGLRRRLRKAAIMFVRALSITLLLLVACGGVDVASVDETTAGSSSSCSVDGDCPRPPPSPDDAPTVDVSDCDRAACVEHTCLYSHVVNGAFESPWTGAHVTCVDGQASF